jgi:small subunit ribosomal protein S9e
MRNSNTCFKKIKLIFRLLLIGQYGLKNKREVWRVQYILARIRKAARDLLTLEESDPKRIFEGEALINRMIRIGVLDRDQAKLDYVLALTVGKFLDRRLQTIVFHSKNAKSLHEARSLIFQKKIGLKRQIVNIPSFIVRKENESYINKLTEEKEHTRTKKRTQKRNDEKAANNEDE